ncbi:hypothetical protein [Planktotalea arctica]|uniref:hypothetical protein n=1 Tax=Planktotalea arctica TaxID=1481893 RepID=UPI000A1768BB|nr:hypothetical protein [Planktotalea arctica]
MPDIPFIEAQSQLAEEWQKKFDDAQTDEERGQFQRGFVLQRERVRAGVTVAGSERDEVDRKTLEKLSNPTELGPELSLHEVIFRRLASDPASAVVYQRTAAAQRSKAQSVRASKSRPKRRDCITGIIDELVAENPKIAAKQVGKRLMDDCDITILEGEYRHNIEGSTLKEENLPSRVSEAKKRHLKSISG